LIGDTLKNKSFTAARIRSASYDETENTVDIVWSTGASVRRYDYWDGTEYDEVLSLDPSAVRLERLNSGAPLLDTHSSDSLDNVIGSVVAGTARIEDGKGLATIKLSSAPSDADTVGKIREGVIKNISVGYWIHKIEKTESDDGKVARWDVTDWEPLEVSAVPIPADPGAQIRSASGRRPKARSRSEGAAAYARDLIHTARHSSAEARGAQEARKAMSGPSWGEPPKRLALDKRALDRGAREAQRLRGRS
jgi:HK97 family phage prohead protease